MSGQTAMICCRKLRWLTPPMLSEQRGRTEQSIGNMFGYESSTWSGLVRWSGHSLSALRPSHPGNVRRGFACRGSLGGAEMGFAWMPDDRRDGSGPVSGQGPDSQRPALAGHRTGRHAQSKAQLPVLAGLAVARLQSLSRARGARRDGSQLSAGETGRDQVARRMAGRGAHAAGLPAGPRLQARR